MKTNDRGIALIKQFEGLRLTAYKPVSTEKYYTIGYGHYGADVKAGQKITEQRAEELLRGDLAKFEKGVNDLKLNINENQFAALVSFAYNVGLANLKGSTLLKRVRNYPMDGRIEREFLRWNKAGGRILDGLTRRRKAESLLYFKVVD